MSRFEPWSPGVGASLIQAREWQILLDLLDPQPGERLLEVYCGRGERLARLSKRGLKAVGLEEAGFLEAARGHLGQADLVREGRAEDLPFEDNAFDLALMHLTLNLTPDPLTALAEAGRVTRRRVVVEVANPWSWMGLRLRWRPPAQQPRRWIGPLGLQSLVSRVFGPSPVKTVGLAAFPQSWLPRLKGLEDSALVPKRLLGGLLFAAVEVRYTLRADALTLPLGVAPASPIGGGLASWPMPPHRKARGDERSLPL